MITFFVFLLFGSLFFLVESDSILVSVGRLITKVVWGFFGISLIFTAIRDFLSGKDYPELGPP